MAWCSIRVRLGAVAVMLTTSAAAPVVAQTAPSRPGAGTESGCAQLAGVEREICIQCARLNAWQRIGCEQRTYWTLCKGSRWINDPYCRTNRDPQVQP